MICNRYLPIVVCLLSAAVLVGCKSLRDVTIFPSTLPASWEARRHSLQSWTRFESHGRVAVASNGEGFSGSWRWVQSAKRARLELEGPLGVGGVRLDFESESGVNEESYAALEQQLGFALPVESLRYWILGVPDPNFTVDERLARDAPRLDSLAQRGWTVTFENYALVVGVDYELPQRIEAHREALRVRLVIVGWGGDGK